MFARLQRNSNVSWPIDATGPRALARAMVDLGAVRLPPGEWKEWGGWGSPDPFHGDHRWNGTTLRVWPVGQWYTPCWFIDDRCREQLSTNASAGLRKPDVVGYHRFTGTWVKDAASWSAAPSAETRSAVGTGSPSFRQTVSAAGAARVTMVRHNNVVPSARKFRKKWQEKVRTWFNQPARKLRRRNARVEKAKAVFPRPVAGALRPVVHGQTVKYNAKKRAGRGFTLEELKEAGIPAKLAPTIGIAVDSRRRNRSLEGLQENVNRLKAYKANLVLFPRRAGKPKAGDAAPEELATAAQLKGALLPGKAEKAALEKVAITAELKAAQAYATLRVERMNKRLRGVRAKRAEEAAAAEKDAA
eukprot:scaffold2.g6840.t1